MTCNVILEDTFSVFPTDILRRVIRAFSYEFTTTRFHLLSLYALGLFKIKIIDNFMGNYLVGTRNVGGLGEEKVGLQYLKKEQSHVINKSKFRLKTTEV